MSHTEQEIIMVFTDQELKLKVSNLKEFCLHILKTYNKASRPETFIMPNGDEYEWNDLLAWKLCIGTISEEQFIERL